MLSKDEFFDAIVDLHNTASRYAAEYLDNQPSDAGKPLSGEDIYKLWDMSQGRSARKSTKPITNWTKINWEALYVEFSAHMSQRPKDMGHTLWVIQFWDDRGGSKRYFDKGPFGETIRREYLLDVPDKRIKIDWDSIHADWSDFWRHRGFAQDQLEGYEEFWKRLGGINRYFDIDDNGVRTCREYMREADEPDMYEAPPKTHHWDGPENVIPD